MLRIAAAIAMIFLCGSLAYAQSLSERSASVSAEDFVRAFLGHCGQNAGNMNRVVAAAEALGYADLPPQMRPLVAPQDPQAEFNGFIALEGEGAPYLLGVSRGQLRGRVYATCTVANPYIDAATIVLALQEFMNIGNLIHEEQSAGQRYRVWAADQISADSFVSLTDAEPMKMGGATLALSSPASE